MSSALIRNIRRLYTTSLNDWTKTSLRRLKKVQLLELAKDNQLKVAGTKNDIIDELLNYQAAKQIPPEPIQHQEQLKEQQQQIIIDERSTKYIPEETFVEDDMAEDWVKAFDMKVAQRGSSSKRPFDDKKSPRIFRPHIEKTKVEIQAIPVEKIREEVAQPKAEPLLAQDIDAIEGMDALWVEAFDRKVGTRGARHHLTDTLSSEPKLSGLGLGLEFVSFESPKNENDTAPPKVVEEEAKKVEIAPELKEKKKMEVPSNDIESTHNGTEKGKKTETINDISHHTNGDTKPEPSIIKNNDQQQQKQQQKQKQQQQQSDVISGVIGSGMLVWYFGGGETFQRIWEFFSSSSS